jgi:transcriptional regulator with XRE-family HTH domain
MAISEQLRDAILAGPQSQYQIAAATGIARSVLSRFVRGRQGIGPATVDVLADYLGLELVKKTIGTVKHGKHRH